jgi:pseudouridine synthase
MFIAMMVRLFPRQSSAVVALATGGIALSSSSRQMVAAFPQFSFLLQTSTRSSSSFPAAVTWSGTASTTSSTFIRLASTNRESMDVNDHSNSVKTKKSSNKKSMGGPKSRGRKVVLFRADKVLSHRGSMSRSQAFDALMRRRVARRKDGLNSELLPIKGPKEKIAMDAIIYMDGKEIPQLPPILIAYNKPKYMLSAMDEKHSDKKHLGMVLPDHYKRLNMHPVGRLDYDTSGLLLFSMEGELTQRLLHPKYKVEKEYVATVMGGRVDFDLLKRQLEGEGVVTSEGTHFAKLLHVEEVDMEKSRSILKEYCSHTSSTDDSSIEPENSRKIDMEQSLTNVRLAVHEGKYRMVRRMLANCNHPVVELKRERYGHVFLKDLQVGEFRECSEDEIKWAESLLHNR